MALRFIVALVVAALVGAAIGYADDGSTAEAVIFALIGVGIVAWSGIKAMREGREFGASAAMQLSGHLPGAKRFVLKAVALAVLALLAISGWHWWETSGDEAGFLWRDAAVELRPVDSLKGVRIGEPLAGVAARLGELELLPPATGASDSPRARHYVQRGGQIRLLVEDERVKRVSYECAALDFTRLNRISCNDALRRVVEVFGGAARRVCANAARAGEAAAQAPEAFAWDVLDTGTRYVTLQGKVRGFVVMAPGDLDGALGDGVWERCP